MHDKLSIVHDDSALKIFLSIINYNFPVRCEVYTEDEDEDLSGYFAE